MSSVVYSAELDFTTKKATPPVFTFEKAQVGIADWRGVIVYEQQGKWSRFWPGESHMGMWWLNVPCEYGFKQVSVLLTGYKFSDDIQHAKKQIKMPFVH